MAGIGTLMFTGVATYYGAMVSRNQLEQSREDAESKRLDQASRVGTWVEYAPDGGIRLHLANPTPDPVLSIEMVIQATVQGRDGDPFYASDIEEKVDLRVDYSLRPFDLPPCSKMIFDPGDWKYTENHETDVPSPDPSLPAEADWKPQPRPDGLFVVVLGYKDHSQRTWWWQDGKPGSNPNGSWEVHNANTHGTGGFVRMPRLSRTASCGASTG
ncbi:hypothetical protein OG245_00245 [Streptomyces sp. NBC_01116]|uniref:hypothetical protein n=1 Tax=Streptomyces sp. NBC_01116 TaxID=2903752 RepID=UPI003252BF39